MEKLEESNSKAGSKCEKCRWFCKTFCIAGLKGWPDAGVACYGYTWDRRKL